MGNVRGPGGVEGCSEHVLDGLPLCCQCAPLVCERDLPDIIISTVARRLVLVGAGLVEYLCRVRGWSSKVLMDLQEVSVVFCCVGVSVAM